MVSSISATSNRQMPKAPNQHSLPMNTTKPLTRNEPRPIKKNCKVVKNLEETYEKEQQEEKLRQEEEETNQPPTMDEKVAAERDKLLRKIDELESYPLDYFGSQRNKIRTLGYYRYRLEDLGKDPEKYFSEPTKFEDNVSHPDDEPKYE